jgi:LacI family transcriptional regulator, galactose operon repressor
LHHIREGTAIKQLGFIRNESARQLRAGRSRAIGLVVPDVANPFFTDVARGVEDERLVLLQRGTPVVLVDSRSPGRGQCPVSVDDVLGGELTVAHLIRDGHSRIAFAGGPLSIRQVAVPMSSVRQPRQLLGRTAAQLLLDEALGEGAHQHRQVVFEPELVVRRSSQARPGPAG